MKIIRKLISTYKLVKDNYRIIEKEYKDLQGVTKIVIGKILEIWI